MLLVDDDPVVRLLLGALLAADGWQVVEAATLADAEAALAGPAPRAVVVDAQLPDGRGTDLAGRLPQLAPGAHVVLHSGEAVAAAPPGVDAVVPKQGPPDALLDHLAALR